MEDPIEIIQQVVIESESLSLEEKEKFFVILELLKQNKDTRIEKILLELSKKVQKNPLEIKNFMSGLEESAQAFFKERGQGILKVLDKYIQ